MGKNVKQHVQLLFLVTILNSQHFSISIHSADTRYGHHLPARIRRPIRLDALAKSSQSREKDTEAIT